MGWYCFAVIDYEGVGLCQPSFFLIWEFLCMELVSISWVDLVSAWLTYVASFVAVAVGAGLSIHVIKVSLDWWRCV